MTSELSSGDRAGRWTCKWWALKLRRPLPLPALMDLDSVLTSTAGCVAADPDPPPQLGGLCLPCFFCSIPLPWKPSLTLPAQLVLVFFSVSPSESIFPHIIRSSLNFLSFRNTVQRSSYLLLLQVWVVPPTPSPCLLAGKLWNAWESICHGAGQHFLSQGAAVLHVAVSCPGGSDSSFLGCLKTLSDPHLLPDMFSKSQHRHSGTSW